MNKKQLPWPHFKRGYFRQLLIAWDQFLNALIGGWADETISARCHRQGKISIKWRRIERVVDFLFLWLERDHCKLSYMNEQLRAHMPPEYRQENNHVEDNHESK